MKISRILLVLAVPALVWSCKKWQDKPGVRDPKLDERLYCNDPEAINYNWNFPGTPDNSTCLFPSDLFKGTFLYTDSVFRGDQSFDSAGSLVTYTLHLVPISKSRFAIIGFCGSMDSLKFTAQRTNFRAEADTIIEAGQFFCRVQDTLQGFVAKNLTDTTHLYINFTVISDTGINYHTGTAIKQ